MCVGTLWIVLDKVHNRWTLEWVIEDKQVWRISIKLCKIIISVKITLSICMSIVIQEK
jgi:hypothetical protein